VFFFATVNEEASMRKNVWKTLVIMMLLSVAVLIFAVDMRPSKASGTIYIRADGSVEGTDKIQRDGDLYTLTGNITDAGGIIIQRSNMTLDGDGYTLKGENATGSRGVYIFQETNVTIRNIRIETFATSIWLENCTDSRIEESQILDSFLNGVDLQHVSGIRISDCYIANNMDNGVYIEYSSNNTIYNNMIELNSLHYLITFLGGIKLYFSSNDTVFQNTIANNYEDGIECWYSSDSKIYNNTITNCSGSGIMITYSSINIYENEITYCKNAIDFWYASGSEVYNNKLVSNKYGLHADAYSENNHIYNNQISSNNETAITFASSLNLIHNNLISDNKIGIELLGYYAKNNTIYANNITNNDVGVSLSSYAANNTFYQNKFVDNTEQVSGTSLRLNFWNGNYSVGGNYWSDFTTRYPTAEDTKSGPYQNETGSDDIWDSPYVIDENNVDNYPVVPELSSMFTFLLLFTWLLSTAVWKKKRTLPRQQKTSNIQSSPKPKKHTS
jgi:parallel beta-helix repeat protein